MAFTISQTTSSDPKASISGTINIPNITVSGSTFNIPAHTSTFKLGTNKSSSYPQATFVEMSGSYSAKIGSTTYGTWHVSHTATVAQASGWKYATYNYSASASSNINTSSIFKSSNPTARTATITVSANIDYDNYLSIGYFGGSATGTATVTLDVPPTATVSAISYDTPYVYAGLTTASVTVSGSAAYYGGSVTDVTLTIGNQSDSLSGDGTLSIALDTAGTFTPTVTVTDSRGQTKSYPLDPITVMTYAPPTVTFTAERTTSAGIPDDEGTYATCPSTFVFADVIATAIAPSVVLTDENGTQTTPTVTWYSSRAADGTLSGSVTWSSLSSGDTVYGLIPGLNPNYSYQISIRPRDSKGTGTAIVQTVSSAFYTVDFLAGGHGIAFGQPSSQNGFYCNMDANFMKDVLIDLPDYQTTGTTDKAIYDAVVALGWDSDVIV